MECGGGGATVEEGAMMTTTESMSVPSSGVGKGDGDCDGNNDGDGDGDSDSGGDAFNNHQMLQAGMECRGGLTVEEGVMMTTTESMSVLLENIHIQKRDTLARAPSGLPKMYQYILEQK